MHTSRAMRYRIVNVCNIDVSPCPSEMRTHRERLQRNGSRISSRPTSPGRPLLNQLSSVFGIVGVQGGWTRAVQATSSAIGVAVSEASVGGDRRQGGSVSNSTSTLSLSHA